MRVFLMHLAQIIAFAASATLSVIAKETETGGPEIKTADSQKIWVQASPSIDPTRLPLGDGKYSDRPKKGYIFPCDPKHYFTIPLGSHTRGPWIHGDVWNITQKPSISGSVLWPNARFEISIRGDRRVLVGNGLPVEGASGVFPIAKRDPAYKYDANPNPIKEQKIEVSIPLAPMKADQPSCLQPQVGYTLDGVALHFALSSMMGHDEIAYEMQDACGGMADPAGIYHRHALSDCIPNIKERNALVGYALDGFGIFSPYDAEGNELTTNDLDECHGTVSKIMWDGKEVEMYHYVLTRDYPYTIGCFQGMPTYVPLPPPPLFALIMSFFVIAWQALKSLF